MVGQFRIVRRLGAGGMGEVYLARDVGLGRRVALKLIRPDVLGDGEAIERFLREARITASFGHPNIVTVYSVGEHQGAPYVALEYLGGRTLRDRLAVEQPSPTEALRIGLAVAEALAAAHAAGIVHRDLKPENVMLPRDGRLRVLDFGLAKPVAGAVMDAEMSIDGERSTQLPLPAELQDGDGETLFATRNDAVAGTPRYMAPEQWQAKPCTGATDLWQLGVMLYELLTGRLPFEAPNLVGLYAAILSDEPAPLGGAVGAEVGALVLRCLCKDPAERPSAREVADALATLLEPGRQKASDDESPFRGLLPFSERHAAQFFGREAEIVAFLERLRDEPVLPVVGPSGSGKSSFVRAGVIPRLREQGAWRVLAFRPGHAPFEMLAARLRAGAASTGIDSIEGAREPADDGGPALAGPDATALLESPGRLSLYLEQLAAREGARVLLFVDQLEELYTLCDELRERRAFMEALCGAAEDPEGPVRVVLSLRDDFLGRVAESDAARQALARITVLRTLDAPALGEVLARPLERVGFKFADPALPGEMARSVEGQPAALAVLQFACSRLWEQRDKERRELTRAAYDGMGGVEGALAHHADEVLAGLTPSQERLARQLLVRLVTPARTRRVVPRAQLVDGLGAEADVVLDRLIEHRTLTIRKGGLDREASVELVHESLIARWGRLARWLDEGREEASFVVEVEQAAELWARRGRQEAELWRGPALVEALARARRCESLPGPAAEFLEAGRRRDRRAALRRTAIVAGAMIALVALAAVLGGLAFEARRARARERLQRAEVLREGAAADLARGFPLEARARLRASLELLDSPRARALWSEIRSNPLVARRVLPAAAYGIALSTDGRRLAAAGSDGSLYVLEADTLRVVDVLRGPGGSLGAVAFSPDGRRLASGDVAGELRLWELATRSSTRLGRCDAGVLDVTFAPSGDVVASGSGDGTVALWQVRGGAPARALRPGAAPVRHVAFSPDGRHLASVHDDQLVRLWDAATGRLEHVLEGHGNLIDGLAFAPSGDVLASSSYDRTVRLWDARTGAPERVLESQTRPGRELAFSPDGRHLFQAGSDGTVGVWELARGVEVGAFLGDREPLLDLRLEPDGRALLTADTSGVVRRWDIARDGWRPRRAEPPEGDVWSVAFWPDGRRLVSAGEDGVVRIWDAATGEVQRELLGHRRRASGVDVSPDGRWIVSASWDRTVRVWDARTGSELSVLGGHTDLVNDVAFDPSGAIIASGSNDGTARLWDRASGDLLRELRGHAHGVNQVDFSPDGTRLVTSADDATLRLWEVGTGRELAVLEGHLRSVYGARFDAAGRRVVSSSIDGEVRVWDVDAGSSRVVARCSMGGNYADFSPDGSAVAAACRDGSVVLAPLDGRRPTVLRGHRAEVIGVRFRSDGRRLATAGGDSSVRLWEVASGRPAWHGLVLRSEPPEVLTQRGWRRVGGDAVEVRGEAWRRAVEDGVRLAAQAPGAGLVCLVTAAGELELWDRRRDARLLSRRVEAIDRLEATPSGCLTLAGGEAVFHASSGPPRTLGRSIGAIAWAGGEILLASAEGGAILDAQGEALGRFDSRHGATAVARVAGRVVVGYREGLIELDRPLELVDLPASAVVALAEGPAGSLVAGFASGQVGVWDLELGVRLFDARLDGAARDLIVIGDTLHAVSELGDARALDLGVLTRDARGLLREVRREVPVVWADGRPVRRAPPE